MKQSLSNVVLDNMGKAATPQGDVSTKWGTVHWAFPPLRLGEGD